MSTENPAPTPTEPPAPPTPAAPPAPAQEHPKVDETDWKAEARKWETQSKANKTAADELAALKAAQMTDAEKATARLADLESTIKGYESEKQVAAWKDEVSKETGVPAAALAGSTLEDLQAHAAVLKTLITAPPVPRGPTVPTEGTKAGVGQVSQLSRDDLKSMSPEQISTARAEGRLNELLGFSKS